MRGVVIVVAVAGCGRLAIDPRVERDAAPEDAAPPDTALPIDGRTGVTCGTSVLLDDPLDDGAAAPGFGASPKPGLALSEANGALDVVFAASVTGGNYAYYRSTSAYPTEGLCVAVELSEVPVNGAAAYLKLRTNQLEVEFFGHGGMLDLRTSLNTVAMARQSVPLDLVGARFWRLRQQGGTTYWDTSPDGIAYTERGALAGFFTALACEVELGAGVLVTTAEGGRARFERVLVTGP